MNQVESKFSVQFWAISRVTPYPGNARKIPEAAIEKVAASIQEFGWRQPIVVDSAGVIIVGHARYKAALRLQMAEVPVHVATGLTPAQVRAYRLADNRTHDETSWDEGLLGIELRELAAMSVDLASTGFAGVEIDQLLKGAGAAADSKLDAIVHPSKKPTSRPGDLYLMGKHRVLCGDSTDPSVVERLLDGATPALMVTDPPYGVDYDPKWRERYDHFERHAVGEVKNDNRADWSPAFKLFPGDVVYIWHASTKTIESGQALLAAGYLIRSVIIWRKQHYAMSRGHYHWAHEPCWYAVRKGKTGRWRGDRKQTTIWDVANLNPMGGNKDEKPTGHGTQKPIELMRRPMLNHTERGAEIYDPFLGSGSTLMAAEATSRVCLGIDIDPAWIDAAVARWEAFTGKKAELVRGKKKKGAPAKARPNRKTRS